MLRIKPRKTWEELYDQKWASGYPWLYPSRTRRWCNKYYKLDAKIQLDDLMRSQGKRVVHYIGYCADEVKRFKEQLGNRDPKVTQIYPLAEDGIVEPDILVWARNQPIYNDYYRYVKRCGCMGCPLASLKELVYLKKYYPAQFDYFMGKAKETEDYLSNKKGKQISVWDGNGKYNTEYRIKRVNEIIEKEKGEQIALQSTP